jgi:hypothetical protein
MSTAIETARELARPGAVFTPADQRALAAGAAAIATRGGPRDDVDRRVVSAAERLAFYGPTREPQPEIPATLLAQIAETEAAVAVELKTCGERLEEIVRARKAGLRSEKPEQAQRAADAVRTAERAYQDACLTRDRIASRLTQLRLQVENIKRDFVMNAHVTATGV